MDIRTERLNKVFEESGMTQTELCEKTGINKGALSSYLSGRYFPKQRALEKLSVALHVSIHYLMGFDVPKQDEVYAKLVAQLNNTKSDLGLFVDYIRDFDAEELKQLKSYAEFIKSKRG